MGFPVSPRCTTWPAWLALAACLCLSASARTLDNFQGGSWQSPAHPPQRVNGALVFPLPMSAVKQDRVYWDREGRWDLSAASSFVLEVLCQRPEAVRALTLSFKSGQGWYSADAKLEAVGSNQLRFSRADFRMEEKPSGWQRIEAIRLSCWKGESVDTRLFPVVLRTGLGRLFIVEAAPTGFPAGERSYVQRFAQRTSALLKDLHIDHGTIGESELSRLNPTARVLVLPFNPKISNSAVRRLEAFVKRGGRLVVCGMGSPALYTLMQVKPGGLVESTEAGRWDQLVFSVPDNPAFPPRIYNHAWSLRPVYPLNARGRTIATWQDARGRSAGSPGVVETPHGFWISPSLNDGDRAGKQRMLCGMIGKYLPEIWKPVAQRGLQEHTRIGSQPSFEASRDTILYRTRGSRLGPRITPMMDQAARLYAKQREQFAQRAYRGSALSGFALKALLVKANAMVQPGRRKELRGIWDHNGVGLYPGGWDETARQLKANGINAVFPNMLWGGKAHVPGCLPPSKTLARYGDQLKDCLRACSAQDIQVHVWKVCWNLEGAPAKFIEGMRKAGRLQMDATGATKPWLSPSHPDNQALEIKALLEVARNYAVAGIHLDYIRFPDRNHCYSPATRQAFERWYGRKVAHWPRDVMLRGPLAASYEKFRAREITAFVQRLSRELKALRPDIQLSAAVFGKYPSCVNSVGQDWVTWLNEGFLDFACPMNYTEDPRQFESWVQNQNQQAPRARIVPGIGLIANESELGPDQVAEQVQALRRLGNPGFVLFKLNTRTMQRTLPLLGAGLMRD